MLTRRNLLQAAAMAAVTMLAGCSEAQDGGLDGNAAANGQTAPVEDTSAEDAPTASGSVLVAYFSATGNTEEIAGKLSSGRGDFLSRVFTLRRVGAWRPRLDVLLACA